ncbi:MAG: Spy/CpxP family protein refolding chaperone [Alphaproteobacteria bacterium]
MTFRSLFQGRRKWFAGAAAVLVLVGIGAAVSGDHHHHRSAEARADWATKVVTRKLDLDAGQREEFRKVADAMVTASADDRTFAEQLVRDTRALVGSAQIDAAAVSALGDRLKSEFDQRLDAVLPAFVAFHASLNNDQRDKLTDRLDRVLRRLAD